MASAQRVEATMQSSISEALLWPSDPTLQIIVATSFCKTEYSSRMEPFVLSIRLVMRRWLTSDGGACHNLLLRPCR